MAFIIFYLSCLLLSTAFAAPNTRIVGGTPTSIEEFPYIAAFVYHYPFPNITIQRCVGSIISSWHVLTTAYCFTGADLNNMLIRAGSTNSLSGGTIVTIREVYKHPDYVESPRANDIAVTLLATPLGMSSTINVLFLPPQDTFIPDGQPVQVVSWGFESLSGPQIEILKTITLHKIPLAECQASYAGNNGVTIDDPVICANEQAIGVCIGDSGAPMAIGQVVVGVASYYEGCGEVWPDVFTRIDRYTNWILEVASATRSNGTMVRTAVPL